jgi:hypothetical protein
MESLDTIITIMALERRAELLPYRGSFYLWSHVPSKAAAAIFLAIFLVLTAMHTWKMAQYRLWFCIPFTLGGLCKLNADSIREHLLILP